MTAFFLVACSDKATPPVDTGTFSDQVHFGDGGTVDLQSETLGVDLPTDLGDAPPADTTDTAPSDEGHDGGATDNGAVIDVQFDAPCQADCDQKICGSDGCDGICGYCTYPEVCDAAGQCVEVCEKECDGKICGPDGCGGDCGTCDEGFNCGDDGLCYVNACEPICAATGNICGGDGCGGDCGVCGAPKICGGFDGCQGLCCALGPCGTVDEVGECQGDLLVACEGEVNLLEINCAEQEGYTCLFDPLEAAYTCAEEPECEPKCAGKSCGSDGCDGVCGTCTSGWSCELGTCQKEVGASCGTVTELGECEQDLYWFCVAGKLYTDDCTLFGTTCGFKNGTWGCI